MKRTLILTLLAVFLFLFLIEPIKSCRAANLSDPNTSEIIIINLKDSLMSKDLQLLYSHQEKEWPEIPEDEPEDETVRGVSEGIESIQGELELKDQNVPDFEFMERKVQGSLECLLPADAISKTKIDNQPIDTNKAKHYVYGQDSEGNWIPDSNIETPDHDTELPSWWTKLIGESRLICGIFNTCSPIEPGNIKINPGKKYAPGEGIGTQPGKESKEEKATIYEKNRFFKSQSLLTRIVKTITKPIKKMIEGVEKVVGFLEGKEETEKAQLTAQTRGTVKGGENVIKQTRLFQAFIPAGLIKGFRNDSLAVSADYDAKAEGGGSLTVQNGKKIEYEGMEVPRKNFCLAMCAQLPDGMDIESYTDGLCPSCEESHYQLEGYGDYQLSQELCQRRADNSCDYYDPEATAGCGPEQDPFCESGICNPYEIDVDSNYDHCGGPPHGSCVDDSVCYVKKIAPNPNGGFGECQYANPHVCVRADRLEIGKCAAVCNWACCAWQERK